MLGPEVGTRLCRGERERGLAILLLGVGSKQLFIVHCACVLYFFPTVQFHVQTSSVLRRLVPAVGEEGEEEGVE